MPPPPPPPLPLLLAPDEGEKAREGDGGCEGVKGFKKRENLLLST